MKNLRKYGTSPFKIAVIHGGPGAPGEMAPVAKELSSEHGILEPLQTAASIEGQVEELKTILKKQGQLPVTLIGYSWGAWLSYIFAANYPDYINKLILVSSGPCEEKYASEIMETRLGRLSSEERAQVNSLLKKLNDAKAATKQNDLSQLADLMTKADSFAPCSSGKQNGEVKIQPEIYQIVWAEASKLRKTGELLDLGRRINCPVVAIHGDYDPHPYEGVKEPLSQVVDNFRFILLENCGHIPWIEKKAKGRFYQILKTELN